MNIFCSLPGHVQLGRLINLRSVAVVAQLLTLLIVWKILDLKLEWLPMLMSIATLATINFLSWFRLRNRKPVSNPELFMQLSMDVIELGFLLYYSGGSTNPFVSLYLLPLVIAAATLPAAYTWGMAALTTASYSMLMFYYIPLPHNHQDMHMNMEMNMDMGNAFNAHVTGMWLGFVISAVVVAYFVVRMAQAVRDRDEMLVQVREEILRNERIVTLGIQAAGAAHELGTPLATMAVVIGELQHDAGSDELSDSLCLLDEQVRACRHILDKMMLTAQDSGRMICLMADQFMAEVLNEWQLLRPAAQYQYHCVSHAPFVNVDATLRAALMNLLNNAADASDKSIDINTRVQDSNYIIEIRDYGSGLSDDAMLKAGEAFFTTKAEGRGLGLFLANATIERMGGSVRLYNLEGGGACTELRLPFCN
jgi:two-component system sensor histidine kinase RegB